MQLNALTLAIIAIGVNAAPLDYNSDSNGIATRPAMDPRNMKTAIHPGARRSNTFSYGGDTFTTGSGTDIVDGAGSVADFPPSTSYEPTENGAANGPGSTSIHGAIGDGTSAAGTVVPNDEGGHNFYGPASYY